MCAQEPKEHVHIHRVVRQGALQGTLTFVGMLLPLLALRALFLPEHFWETLPMAARCAAGARSSSLRSRASRTFALARVRVRIGVRANINPYITVDLSSDLSVL